MDTINKARYILNFLFLAAAAATLIIYIVASGSPLFFYTGVAAITFKMIEFILRFIF